MILTKFVNIKMNAKWISIYRNMGYQCNVGDIIEVNINDVPKKSHCIVDVKCDICGSIKKLKFQVYNKNTRDNRYYGCSIKCSNEKYISTSIKKYGVVNPMKNNDVVNNLKNSFLNKYGYTNPNKHMDVRKKISNTNLEKYGVENPFQSEEIKKSIKSKNMKKYGFFYASQLECIKNRIKNTKIKNGHQIPDELNSEFKKYRNKVNNITNIIKSIIIENWDGYDYYDGEYIRENFNLGSNDKNYPHFDHKISVYYGFINNISPEEIASIDNICITKGYINSRKCKLTEEEFVEKLRVNYAY